MSNLIHVLISFEIREIKISSHANSKRIEVSHSSRLNQQKSKKLSRLYFKTSTEEESYTKILELSLWIKLFRIPSQVMI